MTTAVCNKALEILSNSRDGDSLAPGDLKLLENAVNGFLNNDGIAVFNDLHQRVMQGDYDQRWLHGITHLTADRSGFVYYKDRQVEHYDHPHELSSVEPLKELARRCAHVESLGIEPSTRTVIWRWQWFEGLTMDCPWLVFFARNAGLWEGNDSLIVVVNENLLALINSGGMKFYKGVDDFLSSINCEFSLDDIDYHKFAAAGYGIPDAGQGENMGIIFSTAEGVISLLEKYNVPRNFFEIADSQA